jgi:hypothetical protein
VGIAHLGKNPKFRMDAGICMRRPDNGTDRISDIDERDVAAVRGDVETFADQKMADDGLPGCHQ